MSMSIDEDLNINETENNYSCWCFREDLFRVEQILETHLETAPDLSFKSKFSEASAMRALLQIIDMMILSPQQSLREDDLEEVDNTILDFEDIGFKLDWLKKKVVEIRVNKKKALDRAARMRELNGKILKKMQKLSVLEDELKKEQSEEKSDESEYSFNFFV